MKFSSAQDFTIGVVCSNKDVLHFLMIGLQIIIQMYTFEKYAIPEDPEGKMSFVEKLMKYGISIQQYEKAYRKDDVTM